MHKRKRMRLQQRCLEWLAQLDSACGAPPPPLPSPSPAHLHTTLPLSELAPVDDDVDAAAKSSPHDSARSVKRNKKRKRGAQSDPDQDAGARTLDMAHQLANIPDLLHGNEQDSQDNEETPRKRSRRQRRRSTLASASASSTTNDDDDSLASVSLKSSSPAKHINQLHALDVPVRDQVLQDHLFAQWPAHITSLAQHLHRCQRLRQCVPSRLKALLRKNNPMSSIWEDDEGIWKSDDADSTSPDMAELDALVQEAAELQVYNDPESAWNSQCHGPLLILARRLSPHRKHIRVANITHARLQPHLIPEGSGKGKMVDFGILLQTSDSLSSAYASLDPCEDGIRYFNHSSAQSIARNPLAISIETKRPDSGGPTAKLQLRIWAAAQFSWLARVRRRPVVDITKPASSSPSSSCIEVHLPLLVVTGSQWSWFFAVGAFDRDTCKLLHTTVYNPQRLIGDVSTLEGTFAVLEALNVLIEWTMEHWTPWLERWLGVG